MTWRESVPDSEYAFNLASRSNVRVTVWLFPHVHPDAGPKGE